MLGMLESESLDLHYEVTLQMPNGLGGKKSLHSGCRRPQKPRTTRRMRKGCSPQGSPKLGLLVRTPDQLPS